MNSLLSKITEHINNTRYLEAEELGWQLYNQNKKDFVNIKTLALTLLLQNKHHGALDFYLKAYELDKKDYDILVNISYLYNLFEEFQLSYDFCQKALEINTENHLPYITLIDLLIKKRNFEEAYNYSNELLKRIDFQNFIKKPNVIYLVLDSYLAANKQDEALKLINYFYQKVFNADIFYYHSTFSPETISKEIEKVALKISEKTDFNSLIERGTTLGPLYFGLAKYNEKIKNKELSDEQYIKANNEIFSIQRYQPMANQKLVNNIKNIFINNTDLDYVSSEDDGLIFIVGMPRSGTTLVESIIASNKECISGGELRSIYDIFKSRYEFDNEVVNIQDPANTYLQRIKFIRGDKKYFIDKLPGNYHNVGFIKKIFPNSKIIYLKRDPWDTAISLFKQFYVSNIPYASSFFNLGVVYANHEELMRFWEQDQKIDFLTIAYEDLVKDTGTIAQKIYDFCKIEGAYKSDERKNYFARTASKNQVTKDIHTQSIGKKSFESLKSDFLTSLENQRLYWHKK